MDEEVVRRLERTARSVSILRSAIPGDVVKDISEMIPEDPRKNAIEIMELARNHEKESKAAVWARVHLPKIKSGLKDALNSNARPRGVDGTVRDSYRGNFNVVYHPHYEGQESFISYLCSMGSNLDFKELESYLVTVCGFKAVHLNYTYGIGLQVQLVLP